jgi:hypothetical protein
MGNINKKEVKIIAFYLPQFHTIPENDEWWGKGFTEWTNVRKATPLFKNHYQPRTPLNDNYYNLEDVDVMKWQAKLAKEYGIYGFCYYHYWFNGKKLLEKPLENMLKASDVQIPFCLSWANEPWARTWDGRDTDVLMPQEYGTQKEWAEHFEYLLDFFNDPRYIKIEGKPMMVIYRTSSIPKVNEMIDLWEKLSIEAGFNGLHIVETLNSLQKGPFTLKSEACMEFEPSFTLYHRYYLKYRVIDWLKKKFTKIEIKNYDNVYDCIVNKKSIKDNKKRYLGAFVGWDNSPRKGKGGVIILGSTPEKFAKYLKQQFLNAKKLQFDFIFVNAWNEWAEGAYLEPDNKYGYNYIEAIKRLND